MNNNTIEPDSRRALREAPFTNLGNRILLIRRRSVGLDDQFLETCSWNLQPSSLRSRAPCEIVWSPRKSVLSGVKFAAKPLGWLSHLMTAPRHFCAHYNQARYARPDFDRSIAHAAATTKRRIRGDGTRLSLRARCHRPRHCCARRAGHWAGHWAGRGVTCGAVRPGSGFSLLNHAIELRCAMGRPRFRL